MRAAVYTHALIDAVFRKKGGRSHFPAGFHLYEGQAIAVDFVGRRDNKDCFGECPQVASGKQAFHWHSRRNRFADRAPPIR
jgi:hypothetical protein